ncbi:LysR family transcriptional regulator [Devosia pacifica]|uniref:LysR family transcriptional regulator n=1 Tax=Devosia pacifica TaxID=1335967 RepID=A0A918VP12_9HYPH|nr:LysR family transcriptional regulator [Devosia pacifica]GHA13625.1 LysR family transcriptional regulator [Devosia pacifica]
MSQLGYSKRFLGFRLGEADIRLIRIFCAVAEAGGFSAAQSELQMSMPAISRAVSGLEARLDSRLCTRGRRGFMLTDAGLQVLEMGGRLLGDLDRFEREMRHLHQAMSGRLRLGMVDCVLGHPSGAVPALIDRIKGQVPSLDIEISIARVLDVEQGVTEGRFDAGIVAARQRQSRHLTRYTLYEEASNLYCAHTHPLAAGVEAPEQLSEYDYAGFTSAQGGPRTKYTQFLKRTASVDHVEALAVLVASGRYIGFLPDHYVDTTPALAGAVPVMPRLFRARARMELAIKADQPPAMARLLMEIAQNSQNVA